VGKREIRTIVRTATRPGFATAQPCALDRQINPVDWNYFLLLVPQLPHLSQRNQVSVANRFVEKHKN